VIRKVTEEFLPVRLHVREQAEDFRRFGERFGAHWTPTILMLGPAGVERHRIEGFLPTEDFLAQLDLGLGRIHFSAGRFEEAEDRFRRVVDRYPLSDAAPEALYWAGVSRYKRTDDSAALADTARAFGEAYEDTVWAKKASVWRSSPSKST
jgi:tetratricopeptide (TPR) repeat protein